MVLEVLTALMLLMESKTLQADIRVTVGSVDQNPMTYVGSMRMKGRCFAVDMMGMEASYDGQTMYVYSEDTEEMTLSKPTAEELLQTNPFLFAKELVAQSDVRETALREGQQTMVSVYPKNKETGVEKFQMRVETQTLLPLEITMTETSGRTTTLLLMQPDFTDDSQSYVLQKEGAYINDLR